MPLLGSAAMLLSFDIDAPAIDEHDRWHTHEHLPERLSIPGFRRGTRWLATANGAGPRYMVVYEVDDLATLTSPAYLERLDNPTPWTARMMPHYRGMNRGLCTVVASVGFGQGGVAALVRFTPAAGQQARLDRWLLDGVVPAIPGTPGLGSAHLLQGAQQAPMTNEQRIRGADVGVDSALIVMGYDSAAVESCMNALCAEQGLQAHGAAQVKAAAYRWSYSLSRAELGA